MPNESQEHLSLTAAVAVAMLEMQLVLEIKQ